MVQHSPLSEHDGQEQSVLRVVYAQYQRDEPFSPAIFEGFTTLRVLTYSASISMIVKMLNLFERVECVFGYESILQDFSQILALQKIVCDNLIIAIQQLDDRRKQFILERVHEGQIRFFVVKGAIAHAKIYLLDGADKRRVIVGSANASERAFSGKQAETLIVFDDEQAWHHYRHEYELVRQHSTNEFSLTGVNIEQAEILLEELPLVQEIQREKTPLKVFVNTDVTVAASPRVIRTIERLAASYRPQVQSLVKPKNGQIEISREVIGKVVHLVKSQKRTEAAHEPTWLSIRRDTQKVLLTGREVPLAPSQTDVQSDVACFFEYFENFRNGFHGDVFQHQKDYFLFLCWFYFSPFICELRNHAIAEQEFIFDFPLFAILYGKSNCGKTRLIETLMRSMFGYHQFVEKSQFTRTNLRDLLYTTKRFPVVFDDVEKKRFTDHATDIIKDETFLLDEYPAFVLSMNAEDHSFSTEIRKRCLILYTKASLPDNTDAAKQLFTSVKRIQQRLSTALYREYLRRTLGRLAVEPFPTDMIQFSSEIVTSIFAEAIQAPLPPWCRIMTIGDYQGRKYEKIQAELLKLYETNPKIWEVRRDEVILSVQQADVFGLRKEIPDWLLKEGSKAGNIVLDRIHLEDFLRISFKSRWWRFFRR